MCTTDSVDPDLRKAPTTEFGNDPAIQSELEELGADSPWVEGQKVVQKEVCAHSIELLSGVADNIANAFTAEDRTNRESRIQQPEIDEA